jgi:hypothetical protein
MYSIDTQWFINRIVTVMKAALIAVNCREARLLLWLVQEERQARRVVAALLACEVLESDSQRALLRLAFSAAWRRVGARVVSGQGWVRAGFERLFHLAY